MYDRANRDLVQICGSTNEQVGPGTYDNDVLDPKKLRAGVFMLSPCLYGGGLVDIFTGQITQ